MPGPAADEGGAGRDRGRIRRDGRAPAGYRERDDRDDGHDAAGLRHRLRAHDAGGTRHRRHHRHQLRDGAGADGGARALPGAELAAAGVHRAERGTARDPGRGDVLPAHARGVRALPAHLRGGDGGEHRGRVLRDDAGALRGGHRGGGAAAAQGSAGNDRGGLQLALHERALRAGHVVPGGGGADERDRVAGVPGAAAGRGHGGGGGAGAGPSRGRRACARPDGRLRRSRGRAGRRALRAGAADAGHLAACVRLDRGAGDRDGAEAVRRQGGRELDQP